MSWQDWAFKNMSRLGGIFFHGAFISKQICQFENDVDHYRRTKACGSTAVSAVALDSRYHFQRYEYSTGTVGLTDQKFTKLPSQNRETVF